MIQTAPYPITAHVHEFGRQVILPDDAKPFFFDHQQKWMPHAVPYTGEFAPGQTVYIDPWLQDYKGAPAVAIITRVRGFKYKRHRIHTNQLEIGGFPCQWSCEGHFTLLTEA